MVRLDAMSKGPPADVTASPCAGCGPNPPGTRVCSSSVVGVEAENGIETRAGRGAVDAGAPESTVMIVGASTSDFVSIAFDISEVGALDASTKGISGTVLANSASRLVMLTA